MSCTEEEGREFMVNSTDHSAANTQAAQAILSTAIEKSFDDILMVILMLQIGRMVHFAMFVSSSSTFTRR